jgi:hypothetical protein
MDMNMSLYRFGFWQGLENLSSFCEKIFGIYEKSTALEQFHTDFIVLNRRRATGHCGVIMIQSIGFIRNFASFQF